MKRYLLLPLLLAGCVSQGPFPSLAPRPGERLAVEEPVREAPEVAPDPALLARARELGQQAERGRQHFDAAWPAAEAAARRAGPEGSDSWIAAEQALSRLTTAHMEAGEALSGLDQLVAGRADLPTNSQDYETIAAARATAQSIVDDQLARLGRLRSR